VIPLELEKSTKAINQLRKVSGKAATAPLQNLFRNTTPKNSPKRKYPEEIDMRKELRSISMKDKEKP
jgi:hypothetical protein